MRHDRHNNTERIFITGYLIEITSIIKHLEEIGEEKICYLTLYDLGEGIRSVLVGPI